MAQFGQDLASRNTVAAPAIGDDAPWLVFEAGQQALEDMLGCSGISARLYRDVEHHTVLVHGSPELIQLAAYPQEYLIHVSGAAGPRPQARLAGEVAPELQASLADACVCDSDAPLGGDEFHVPQAQAEDVVQPCSTADHLGREAVSGVGGAAGRHPTSLAQSLRFDQRS
jgi:hypothetical protein